MSDDNGTSSGGGNSSVWWEVRGSRQKQAKPKLANLIAAAPIGRGQPVVDVPDIVDHPGPGEMKIGRRKSGEGLVQGHDETTFDKIGVPDHPGKFRVCLRFRKEDFDRKDANGKLLISPAYRDWIEESAKRLQAGLTGKPAPSYPWNDEKDVYLVIDVPAVLRKPMPADGGAWKDQPWEVHWEW